MQIIKLRHVHSSSAISDSVQTVNISSLRHCIRLISDHAATTFSDQIDSLQRSNSLSESSLNRCHTGHTSQTSIAVISPYGLSGHAEMNTPPTLQIECGRLFIF